ncbi:hypothetical protein AAFF_G00143390 [Aldrovandia affinis]|uniref:Uncharacterized protein n=1 Tax=Aldrovandia affinis TaxID=143900 RepID=A0AAD7T1F5_9TELE|nr:hypothetical protein AAFF_G00143390 [Aldrovandia affinis]
MSASESLEERAVRILGIPLLDSSIQETKSVELPPDPAGQDTGDMQESPAELPSTEPEPEVADKSGQDEDVIRLYKSDTAVDSQLFMDMENTHMDMEAMVKSAEICSDTTETEGNQGIRLVVENNEVTEDARSERMCMEMATCNRPEEEGANMEKETSECTCHTAECHYAEDAMPNRGTIPKPGMGLTCDLFVTGVAQQGEEPAALITDQQEASILPPEEEGNQSLEDILQDFQEKERVLFGRK